MVRVTVNSCIALQFTCSFHSLFLLLECDLAKTLPSQDGCLSTPLVGLIFGQAPCPLVMLWGTACHTGPTRLHSSQACGVQAFSMVLWRLFCWRKAHSLHSGGWKIRELLGPECLLLCFIIRTKPVQFLKNWIFKTGQLKMSLVVPNPSRTCL